MKTESDRIKNVIRKKIKQFESRIDTLKRMNVEEDVIKYESKIECLEEILMDIEFIPRNPLFDLFSQNYGEYSIDLTLGYDDVIRIRKDDLVSFDGEWIIIHEKIDSDERVIPPILKVFNINNGVLAESGKYDDE